MIASMGRDGLWKLEGPDPVTEAMMDRQFERIPGTLTWRNKVTPVMQIAGLGDVVKRMTDLLGIAQCGGCKDRQEWLNQKFPNPLRGPGSVAE